MSVHGLGFDLRFAPIGEGIERENQCPSYASLRIPTPSRLSSLPSFYLPFLSGASRASAAPAVRTRMHLRPPRPQIPS
jgi:hypothetical protein